MTIRRLFSLLLLLAVFAMAVTATTDPDVWWHLRTGEAILEGDGLPRVDLFSYTVPDHPWITHEWLSQAFMWLVYRLAGLPGLMLVFAAISAAAFWLAYRASPGQPYIAGFLTLLAAVAASVVFGARPQIFNLLFAAAFVYVLEGIRAGRLTHRALWWLPALTVPWANFHSGYLLGVAILAVATAGAAIEAGAGARSGRPLQAAWLAARPLGLATVACLLAAALNPNGPALWLYPFETLGSNAMQAFIQEWQSPNFHVPIFWAFGLLLALGLLGMVAGREAITPTDLLLFLGAGAAGLQSARNIPLFALVVVPILARCWVTAFRRSPRLAAFTGQGPEPAGVPILNGLLLFLALLSAAGWVGQKVLDNDEAIAAVYPVAAVDFLEAAGRGGDRVYNSYGWGGYLIWRGWPVFVDGRADVYGDAFLFDYVAAYDVQPNWREPLDAYDVALVLMERDAPLATLLEAAPGWQAIYGDEVARVFARDLK